MHWDKRFIALRKGDTKKNISKECKRNSWTSPFERFQSESRLRTPMCITCVRGNFSFFEYFAEKKVAAQCKQDDLDTELKVAQCQVFLYIRLRTQLKDTSPSSRLIYFELFCNQLVLFPTARTTKRRNLMLVVGNKISVLGGYILPVKSCGFFQGILKAKVL